MAECQTLLLEARTLGDDIRSAQQNVLKFRLLGRGPDLWTVAITNLRQANTLPAAVQAFLLDRMQIKHLRSISWTLLVMLSTLGVGLGLWWRRWWRSRLMQGPAEGISAALSTSLQACFARRLPLILGLTAASSWPCRPSPSRRLWRCSSVCLCIWVA